MSAGRRTTHAVVSLAVAQGLAAVASLVRLPFVIDALGSERFGAYVVVGSLAPFLMVATAGSRVACRAMVAERLDAGESAPARALADSLVVAKRIAAIVVMVGVPTAVVVGAAVGHRTVGSGPELVVVLAATVVACAASTVGGAAWGWLEAHGRQTLVHSLVAAVAVVGLAVTVVAARATSSFVALSLVNLATTVAPFLLAVGWIVRREVPRAPSTPSAVAASQRATLQATARAVPPLGARALDPLLIAPSLGAASAGAYGLGQRLSLPNTLVIQATAPVVASDLARRRGGGEDLAMGVVARVALLQALASAACGAVLVIVGPWLGGVLSHHELVVPRSLFVAFGVAGVVFSASESLASVSSGPRGLAVGWRIDGIGLVVNVVASLVLLGPLGMAGPVWGSAAAASVTLAIWIVVHARRPDLRSETHGDEPCGGPPLVWAPLDDRPPGGDQLGREQLGGHVDSWRSAAPTSTGAGS